MNIFSLSCGMKNSTQYNAAVYFGRSFPVCSREAAMHQRQTDGNTGSWADVALCDEEETCQNLSRDAAIARPHQRRPDGSLVSGAMAFTTLWRMLPRWERLGQMLGSIAALRLLEAGYRAFPIVRRGWRKA